MTKRLAVLVTILLISILALLTAKAEEQAAISQAQVYAMQDAAWSYTCQALQDKYDCSRVPQPVVAYTDVEAEENAWGMYSAGTAYVEISIKQRGTRFSQYIMVHEMTHYLQWVHRDFKYYTDVASCQQEKEAHTVAMDFANMVGIGNDPNVLGWEVKKAIYDCLK